MPKIKFIFDQDTTKSRGGDSLEEGFELNKTKIKEIVFEDASHSLVLIENREVQGGIADYIISNLVKVNKENKTVEMFFGSKDDNFEEYIDVQSRNNHSLTVDFLPLDMHTKIMHSILGSIYRKRENKILDKRRLTEYIGALHEVEEKNYLIYFFMGLLCYLKAEKSNAKKYFVESRDLVKNRNCILAKFLDELIKSVFASQEKSFFKEKLNYVFLFSPEENESDGAIKFFSVINRFSNYGLVLNTRKMRSKKQVLQSLENHLSSHKKCTVVLSGHANTDGFILHEEDKKIKMTASELNAIVESTSSEVLLLDFACTDKHFATFQYSDKVNLRVVYSMDGLSNNFNGEYYSFGYFTELDDSANIDYAHTAGTFTLSMLAPDYKRMALTQGNEK